MIVLLVLLSVLCTTLHAQIDCSAYDITFIPWRVRNPSCQLPSLTPGVSNVIIHQTPEVSCALDDPDNPADPDNPKLDCIEEVQGIQEEHMDERKWKDIGYNFLIDANGKVYVGRGWGTIGYYARYYEETAISIALIGDFAADKVPSEKAKAAALELIACGKAKNVIEAAAVPEAFHDGETICSNTNLYTVITGGLRPT